MPEVNPDHIPEEETNTARAAAPLWAEVRRLLLDERDRVAASAVLRVGEASLATYLAKICREMPEDAWVFDQLCRALWRQNELTELETTIQVTASEKTACIAAGWKILLAAKKQDKAALVAGLAAYVRVGAELGDFPNFLEHELASLRCQRELDTALEAAVEDASVGMSFAALHTRRACHRHQWEVRQHFPAWVARAGARAAEPVGVFMDQIGDAREAGGSVPAMIAEMGPWMKEQSAVYGKTGYALASSLLHEQTAAWLDGCETRADLQGWVAANHVLALWKLHRYKQAGTVSGVVLQRRLRDNTWNWHVAAAAFDHALSGRSEQAQSMLDLLADEKLTHADFAWALELARSITRLLRLAQSESKRVFKEERGRLQRLAASLVSAEDAAIAQERYGMAVEAMARNGGFSLWPWQRRLRLSSGVNPFKSWLWIAGTVLLLVAVLRGCVIPTDGSGIFQNDEEEEDSKTEMPQAPSPHNDEIDKLLNKPQHLKR